MGDDCEKVNMRCDLHDREIKELKEFDKDLAETVQDIKNIINTVKNWIIGGVVVLAVKAVGISAILAKIIGL